MQSGTAAQTAASPDGRLGASQPRPGRAAARAGDSPASDSHLNASDFGANQWLVDELYQRYLADPGSVDPAWWSFFSDYRSTGSQDEEAPAPARADGAAPASAPAATAPSASIPAAPAPAASAPAGPVTPARPAPATPAPPASPATVAPQPQAASLPPGERHRLRGAAARTAVNMSSSLVVPTATSVRDIPAMLLIDNRIVINNHLRRGRGGKVSFTHLIGYAVVRALAAVRR